jgi:hypothetical protein
MPHVGTRRIGVLLLALLVVIDVFGINLFAAAVFVPNRNSFRSPRIDAKDTAFFKWPFWNKDKPKAKENERAERNHENSEESRIPVSAPALPDPSEDSEFPPSPPVSPPKAPPKKWRPNIIHSP